MTIKTPVCVTLARTIAVRSAYQHLTYLLPELNTSGHYGRLLTVAIRIIHEVSEAACLHAWGQGQRQKGKTPCARHEGVIAPLIFNLENMRVVSYRHWPLYPGGRPGIHSVVGWVGPSVKLDVLGTR